MLTDKTIEYDLHATFEAIIVDFDGNIIIQFRHSGTNAHRCRYWKQYIVSKYVDLKKSVFLISIFMNY